MFLEIDLHNHEAQVTVVIHDGNLQDGIRRPTDRLDKVAEESDSQLDRGALQDVSDGRIAVEPLFQSVQRGQPRLNFQVQ